MATLKELMDQQVAIAAKIDELRKSEHANVIAQIKGLIAEHMLTPNELFGAPRGRKAKVVKAKSKVAPKYRDQNGNEWTGRGRSPKWLEGKDKSKFLIT